MRGSNALLAKAETTLLVNDGLITTMKMRDGQRGQKFPFEIKIVNLWESNKGKRVGAPVAVEPERGTSMETVDKPGRPARLLNQLALWRHRRFSNAEPDMERQFTLRKSCKIRTVTKEPRKALQIGLRESGARG